MTHIEPVAAQTAEKRRALLHRLMAERGLSRSGAADLNGPSQPIVRRPGGLTLVPQSFAQQRLWFLDRLAPGNPFYTVSLSVAIHSRIDLEALQRALDALVYRHESLRTTFTEQEGQALQRIAEPRAIELQRIDLRHLPADERQAEAERLACAENSRSFDLEVGPLMVVRIVTLTTDDHRLLLTLHHIICDGWSLRVLSQELVSLYSAFATRTAPHLAELPVQYADFALWQRERMSGDELERQLEYWRTALAGAPELRLLPDKVRPSAPTFRGGLVPIAIPASQAQLVSGIARETNTTAFVVLLSALAVLLGRLSGQEDILIGTPLANRTRPELEPLIGFFVNTLVMRADLRGEPSFAALVHRMRSVALDAFANQDLPFERLVEELAPERIVGRNPLFQVIFQLFSAHDGAVGDDAPAVRQRGTAKFDLRLDLWPTRDGGYAGELEYSDDVFHAATAQQMVRQFRTLLWNLLSDPLGAVNQAAAMNADEERRVIEEFNATAAPYPADIGIAALFREIAARTSLRLAVRFADGELTYGQLDATSDAMACRLAARGVRQGDAVAVLLDRSVAMIVAWLGILKLGAAYVPLDTEQPRARLAGMIADAGCNVAVTAAPHLSWLQGLGIQVERSDMPREAPPVVWPEVRGGEIAEIIFTSGSTGRPKGVRITHRGIARLTRGIDWVSFRPGDKVAQTSNAAFDATTYEIWSALLNGCVLIEIDRNTSLDPQALEDRLRVAHVDHLFLTTALFTRMAAQRPHMFANLRSLMTGGATADVASFRAVLEAGPPLLLFNAYGPTETTVLGSVWTATQLPADAVSVPIGRPVTNTSCYVLDDRLRPVPPGAPGQLYIGGPGVAAGYVGRPDLTAERFIANPWRQGDTLYRTGDRVRWSHDGQLHFLGRMDDQVKIRGFRVEPQEIAATLCTYPAVNNACVIPYRRGEDDCSLVAYVELKQEFATGFDTAALAGAADKLVAHWRELYDAVLYDAPGHAPTFNTSGWNDTATGVPIPQEDMLEQVTQTVHRVLATGAQRVLEIGCGTGMLLFRLAPRCERYVGLDLSTAAIEHVRRTAATLPDLAHVELVVGPATDLVGVAEGQFDLILLNSVVQYFPSFDYLVEVVRAAAARLKPGGGLYLGDLRHLGLLHAFHADVLLRRCGDEVPLDSLRDELLRRVDEEQELVLAPAAVAMLGQLVPGFALARIELKRGRLHNELSRFRYDALLRWQSPSPVVATSSADPLTLHWSLDLDSSIEQLEAALVANGSRALRIKGVPNSRVAVAQQAARDIADLRSSTAAELRSSTWHLAAFDPEAMSDLGVRCGRAVAVTWNATDDAAFDALFAPANCAAVAFTDAVADARPVGELVTHPLRGHFARRLVPELQAHLAARLPSYMCPQDYVRLKQLPMSANGKIDRSGLPMPQRLRPELRKSYAAATNETERRLVALWARVLSVAPPGIHEHFFNDLGGHSLLATQLMSRVRSEFGIELPLRLIFEGPTIAALAAAIDAAGSAGVVSERIEPSADTRLTGLDLDQLDEAALDAALEQLRPEGES